MNNYSNSMGDGSICPGAGDDETGAAAGSGADAGFGPAVGLVFGRFRQTLPKGGRGWDWKQLGILRDAWERKLPL